MGWYKKDYVKEEEVFKYIIVKPESIMEILSQNKNFSDVRIVKKAKKNVVLAQTNDGTIFKIRSINKIEEKDDNYSINFSVYNGTF